MYQRPAQLLHGVGGVVGSAGPTTRPLLALLWASISPFVQLEAKWGPQGKGWGSQEPSPGRPKPLSPPCCLARPGGCIPVLIYGVQGGPYFPLPRAVGLQVDLPEGGLRPGHPAHTAAQRTSPRLTPAPARIGERVRPHRSGLRPAAPHDSRYVACFVTSVQKEAWLLAV